jgi:glycopeptide antibiotics resistance protein
MGNFSDSPSWRWRLIVRFFGTMMMLIPFLIGLQLSNAAYTSLSVLSGFLLIMIS